MHSCVRWNHIFSGEKLYFRFLMFQNGSKNQYLVFQRISRKSVKVKFLTYQLAISKTCSNYLNMGQGLFSIDASSDPSKFCDDWPSKSRLNVKFQNQKSVNLTNEKGEFAIAIFCLFRHVPITPCYRVQSF